MTIQQPAPNDIYAALAKALPLVDGAVKDSNNQHFKSKYADLGSVIQAIRPVVSVGIWFRQATREHERGALVETFYVHSSGELSAGETFVPADKQNAQGFGSAMTYARRYGLMAAFGIAPEDDDGNAASEAPPKTEKRKEDTKRHDPEMLDDAQVSYIQQLLESAGMDAKAFCEAYKIQSVKALSSRKFGAACERLKQLSAEKAKKPNNLQHDEFLEDEIPF